MIMVVELSTFDKPFCLGILVNPLITFYTQYATN